jgi:hypothetical protein
MTEQLTLLREPKRRAKRQFPDLQAHEIIKALRRHIGARAHGQDITKPFLAFDEMWFPKGYWVGQRIDLWAISIWGGTRYGIAPQVRSSEIRMNPDNGRAHKHQALDPVTVGFEVKISRSDFLHEVKQPEKRLAGMAVSRAFYFATPLGMVDPEEIPEGCGLVGVDMALRCHKIVPAPVRDIEAPSWTFAAIIAREPNGGRRAR